VLISAGVSAERQRVAVTKAITLAIKTIGQHSPVLRQHLANTIRTGRLCSYTPDREPPIVWTLQGNCRSRI